MGSDVLKRWEEGALTLELVRSGSELRVAWQGKSADREPGRFLVPVLAEAIEQARVAGVTLVLDFRALDYMNSSTFTPVVKAIGDARKAGIPVVLEYSLERKWQALSFSALRTFETLDGRVQVQGR
jgi:hypothetical protein